MIQGDKTTGRRARRRYTGRQEDKERDDRETGRQGGGSREMWGGSNKEDPTKVHKVFR